MLSTLNLDPASITACVNDLLGRSTAAKVRSIACERVGDDVRLTLNGVITGLSVFGMAVPPIDADVLLRGRSDPTSNVLTLTWSIERVAGIPAMAAKVVGKPTLAKFLCDALGARWGLDRALSANDAGDLLLDPSLITIPGCAHLHVTGITLPSADGYVLKADFAWGRTSS